MNMRYEQILRKAAPAVGLIVIIGILLHAWTLLTREPEPAASGNPGEIEAEAAGGIWVEESELEANPGLTLSIKEAVLGASSQKKDLEVFEQHVSDIIKVTDEGRLPFNLSAKYQYIKYSGTAIYTVDLSEIDDEHLLVDEDEKTVTIRIPHAEERLNINEDETQADDTEKIGIFSIGDLKQSEAERAEVIAKVKNNMKTKLDEQNVIETADRMAKLSVWEIYQPVVTKVSPEYTVVTEFTS